MFLVAACGTPDTGSAPAPAATDSVPPAPVAPWTGNYADTVPCADCPGILMILELHADSTYVLRRQYLERDSIPHGEIGEWTVAGDRLALTTPDGPMYWHRAGDGLDPLDREGKRIESQLSYAIRRVAAVPATAMHLTGGYVYYADSHSFTPCGSKYPVPVAMEPAGAGGAALELERTYLRRKQGDGAPLYVRVIATLRPGPAMEGDGTEDYLYVQEVEHVLERQSCN